MYPIMPEGNRRLQQEIILYSLLQEQISLLASTRKAQQNGGKREERLSGCFSSSERRRPTIRLYSVLFLKQDQMLLISYSNYKLTRRYRKKIIRYNSIVNDSGRVDSFENILYKFDYDFNHSTPVVFISAFYLIIIGFS